MKTKLSMIILILVMSSLVFGQKIVQKTLPNGMEVVVKENKSNNSVGFYCYVKTGSIHEHLYQGKGLSHFLEHIVSGGTTSKRTEAEYTKINEEIGALVNAYTIFGVTAYHIQVQNEYLDKALEVLSENVQYCAVDQAEVDREKEVIVKEFVMRVSPPQAQLRNRDRALNFMTSHVNDEVIGYIDLFKTVTRDELYDYYKKRYMPNNMVFVAAGNFDAEETMAKIENAFKDFKRGVLVPIPQPQEEIRSGNYKFIEEFDIQNPVGSITKLVDASEYRDFSAIELTTEILFGKRTAPVNYKLYEELKKVNYVYGYFNQGGYLPENMIKIGFEASNVEELDGIVKTIDDEIQKFLNKGISQKDIDDVISRMKAQKIMSVPTVDDDCSDLGWNMISHGVPEMFDIKMESFSRVKPADIERVIKRYFLDGNRVVFYGVPTGSKQKLENNETPVVIGDIVKKELKDDTTLLHKINTQAPVVHGSIFVPSSTDFEKMEEVGLLEFMVSCMKEAGSEDYSSLEMSSWIEDHAVKLDININRSGLFIEYTVTKFDHDELVKRILDIVNNPLFSEHEVELVREAKINNYQRSLSDPEAQHDEFKKSVLYPGTKDGVPESEIIERIKTVSVDKLKDLHEEFIKSESMVISLFGDIDEATAVKEAVFIREKFPEGSIDRDKLGLVIKTNEGLFENKYDFEQVNVNINYIAPTSKDDDFYTMNVINQILSGQGSNRLHKATRTVNDLAYFAYSQYSWGEDYGYLRMISQTSVQNKDELIKTLQNEAQRLVNGEVTQEEIKLACDAYQMLLAAYFTDDILIGVATSYEARGMGYDFLFRSIEDMRKVTPEMIKACAEKYLTKGAVLVSYPNENVKRVVE
ncbi:MAG: insulinase family protein [Candidatus Delongbacteria bacterium]|nr:insulinase family protein [Candidatus Delongbacteria bacterium]MBN2836736.1 insulinase family protein [Candidatus Delongbacteria bacterium]